jgi:hypothetical protein
MADELKSKQAELKAKKEALEKELPRVCFAIADVEKELNDVATKLAPYYEEEQEKPDPHLAGILKYVSVLHKMKEEDVVVMHMRDYTNKIESELPYGYSSYFDTKKFICSERDHERIAIVRVDDDTYTKISYYEEPEDLLKWNSKYYVAVFTKWYEYRSDSY